MPKRSAETHEAGGNGAKRARFTGGNTTRHAAVEELGAPSSPPPPSSSKLANEEFEVAWICALSKEFIAARAMLDAEYEGPDNLAINDRNVYTLGKSGAHNVVIAVLPQGEYGTVSAAVVARDLLHSFPNIRIGLLVGIGGGVPSEQHDIRLGDVVVSTPLDGGSGVIQYDFGKTLQDQAFRRTHYLGQPPPLLLSAASSLRAEYEMRGHRIQAYISHALDTNPRLRRNFGPPDPSTDRLYQPSVVHDFSSSGGCTENCDDESIIKRPDRPTDEDNPLIHYGLIASGNSVLKDAVVRDRLAREKDILCFEMEAAGLMNQFPCIVIRGICDYADSHKNKDWQGYAALSAAAYTKDLLSQITPNRLASGRRINDIISGIQQDVGSLLRAQHSQETQSILDWLTPIDYRPQQLDFNRRWQPDTGQWLLRSDKYQAWTSKNGQTLFCTGIPGAGKTILTSIVIDDLLAKFENDESVGIAFLYCNFRRHHEQSADDLLVNLLKQLSERKPGVPESVKTLYYGHKEKRTRPLFDEVLKTLGSTCDQYERVFFVVDALDECPGPAALLTELFLLQSRCQANIFATSRPIPEIKESFEGCSHLEISASSEDVQRYLEGHTGKLQPFVQNNQELQNDITTSIAQAVDGMFLLAQIYLNSLEDKLTAKDIRKALQYFPKQKPGSNEEQKLHVLSQAYELSMARIGDQKPGPRKLAGRVLSWISCAKTPLTTTELQHALAVESGTSNLDEEAFSEVRTMVSVCAGLVTVDEGSDIIRLVHYTTQEYLDSTQKEWFPGAEAEISNACITYLSFTAFAVGACSTDQDLKQRCHLYPLYSYAARNWGYHASRAPFSEQSSVMMGLLQSEGNVLAAGQAMITGEPYSGATRHSSKQAKRVTGLHLAAFFGLGDAIAELLVRGHRPDEEDSYGQSPLSYASERGHESSVRLLIKALGSTFHDYDGDGRSPLSYAAEAGYVTVVQLLLQAPGRIADSSDADGRTPLSYAAGQGHAAVVALLIPVTSANTDMCRRFKRTPLSFAAEAGHVRVVEIILEHRRYMADQADMDGRIPLSYCAQRGHQHICRLLLRSDLVKPDRTDRDGRSSLSYAAEGDHGDIVELLLSQPGVDADSKQRDGRTPLSYAAQNGCLSVITRLMQVPDVDPNCRDREGRTPLSYAAEEGRLDTVYYLLSSGVDSSSTDRKGRTPLAYAEGRRHGAVAALLSG